MDPAREESLLQKRWLVLLCVALATWNSHAGALVEDVDRSRMGEQLLLHEVEHLEECARPLQTVDVRTLSIPLLSRCWLKFFS